MPETAPNLSAGAVPPPQAVPQTTNVPTNGSEKTVEKAAAPKDKVALNIYGENQEFDIETLKKDAQKFYSADKLFQQARKKEMELMRERAELSEIRKKHEEASNLGPKEAFRRAVEQFKDDGLKGKELREAVEEYLVEQLKMEQASPEMQQLMTEKQKREQAEKRLKEIEEREQQQKMQAMTNEQRQIWQKKLIDAADASGLPPTEWNLKSMAEVMQKAIKAGYDLSPQQVAEFVRQDRTDNVQALGGHLAKAVHEAAKAKDEAKLTQLGAQLDSVFGKEILDALRLVDLARIRSQRAPVPSPVVETPKLQGEDTSKKRMSWSDAEAERKRIVAELDRQWRSGQKIG